jgi:hypothetical protein
VDITRPNAPVISQITAFSIKNPESSITQESTMTDLINQQSTAVSPD